LRFFRIAVSAITSTASLPPTNSSAWRKAASRTEPVQIFWNTDKKSSFAITIAVPQ